MTTFDPTAHPRATDGEFTAKVNSEPESSLVGAVEGDDHEVELVEAATEDEALERAGEAFSSRYDEEYDSDMLTVAGVFRGDIDDTDELQFVEHEGTTEAAARRALDNI